MRYIYLAIVIVSISLIGGCTKSSGNTDNDQSSSVTVPAEEVPATDSYGIDTTSYRLVKGIVRYSQFLSEIVEDYGVDYSMILEMRKNSGDVFDIRRIKAGNKYTLYVSNDSTGKLDYMVYEDNMKTHYILDFSNNPTIRETSRPSTLKLKYSSGTIETSLWDAMINNDMHPLLAIELSEMYAWTIDFFGLQKGDSFKVIYEEEYIDTLSNGVYRIIAALFNHAGNDFYAIPLIQDKQESYYDINGESLRKAFLKAPLRYSRISSRYSNSRMHPILRIRRPHHGVDYAAPTGTPVLAVGDGKVIMRKYDRGAGRIVKIKHNSVYTTAYMHLSRFGNGVHVGKYVHQGDIIGYVGSTGLSTGPHLDFRFYRNGQAVDPLKVKAPPVEPVSEENKEKFNQISNVIVQLLDSF